MVLAVPSVYPVLSSAFHHFYLSPLYLSIQLPLSICQEKIIFSLSLGRIANPISFPSFLSCYVCIKKSFLFFLSSCPLPILLHQVLFRKTLEQGPQTFPVKNQIVLILDFASHIVSVTVTGLATVACKTTCKRTVCTTLFTKIK